MTPVYMVSCENWYLGVNAKRVLSAVLFKSIYNPFTFNMLILRNSYQTVICKWVTQRISFDLQMCILMYEDCKL